MISQEADTAIINWTRAAARADIETLATISPKAGLDYGHIRPLIDYINTDPALTFAYRMGLEFLIGRLDTEYEDTEAFYGLVIAAAHGFDGIPLAVYQACGTWADFQAQF